MKVFREHKIVCCVHSCKRRWNRILIALWDLRWSSEGSVGAATRLQAGSSRDSNLGRNKRFFFLFCFRYSDRLWGLPSLLFNWYRGSHFVKFTTHCHLVENEWSCISTLPHTPSWRGQGQFYLWDVRFSFQCVWILLSCEMWLMWSGTHATNFQSDLLVKVTSLSSET